MRSDEIRPGDLVAGKYRVRAILSRSRGMLVEAFHTEFDQRVVIRILSPAMCDAKEIERFRREARTLAKLESEHVARIFDVGTESDGTFYFVRQYLEGQDLAAHLKKRGRLPLAEAVLYVLQAAEAMAETHSHHIILREMQPQHLFLTQRLGVSLVKVVDFGTAKLLRDAAPPGAGGELTATTMFGLSPYSSPELVRKAKNVDVRTDIWSLGAILYELLAGKPPFHGEMAALMLAITKDDPVPITQQRPDLPRELDQIIGWCLAKDVDGRFSNVHAFAHALVPYAPPEGQVLVTRIGAMAAAAKERRPPSVPPAPPIGGAAGATRAATPAGEATSSRQGRPPSASRRRQAGPLARGRRQRHPAPRYRPRRRRRGRRAHRHQGDDLPRGGRRPAEEARLPPGPPAARRRRRPASPGPRVPPAAAGRRRAAWQRATRGRRRSPLRAHRLHRLRLRPSRGRPGEASRPRGRPAAFRSAHVRRCCAGHGDREGRRAAFCPAQRPSALHAGHRWPHVPRTAIGRLPFTGPGPRRALSRRFPRGGAPPCSVRR
jgi:hypothetical protein